MKPDSKPSHVQHVTSICSNFYAMFLVPIAWWQGGERLASAGFAEGVEPDRYALPHLRAHLSETDEATVTYSGAGGCVFALTLPLGTDTEIVLGPVFPLGIDEDQLGAFVDALGVPASLAESVRYSVGLIPTMTYERLRALDGLFALLLAEEEVEVPSKTEQWDLASEAHRHAIMSSERLPTVDIHHLMDATASLVRRGDPEGVARFLDKKADQLRHAVTPARFTTPGTLWYARSTLSMLLMEATEQGTIPGGIDVQQAYALLYAYTYEVGALDSVTQVIRLAHTALVDMASMVAEKYQKASVSPEIADCMEKISSNLASCPSIDELARLIGRSRSYTTRRFRAETGFSVGEYVTRCRIQSAKRMLRYTALPTSAISARLGFASQSYFCNVFRRETGTTPRRYRAAATSWTVEEEI